MGNRNPLNAIFIAIYWWVGGYILMASSPEDQLFIAVLCMVCGLFLWFYVEGQFVKGQPVDARLKPMLLGAPGILIVIGVILLIARIAQSSR